MRRKLRAVLAGAGSISKVWLEALSHRSDIAVATVVDPVRENAARRMGEYHLDARYYPVLEAAFEADTFDVLLDCSIPKAHFGNAICALAHGCHVLSEKPVAESTDQVRELIAAADPQAFMQTLDRWIRSTCRAIDYPAFGNAKPIRLPDPLAQEEPTFSGFARYECAVNGTGEKTVLEITDAYEGVEVFVNRQSLGIQIAPPFRYDLTPYLRQGENKLAIEVATTLERENAGLPDLIRKSREKPGWRITSHETSAAFSERSSIRGRRRNSASNEGLTNLAVSPEIVQEDGAALLVPRGDFMTGARSTGVSST